MLVILKIGYQSYLLKSEQGLQTVLKTLSQAQVIERDNRHFEGNIELGALAEVGCEILPPTWVARKGKEVLEPEVMPHSRGDVCRRLTGQRQLPAASRHTLPSEATYRRDS